MILMNIEQFRTSFAAEQSRIRDIKSVAPASAQVPGRVLVNTTGEAFIDVDFPVRFSTIPYFTCGFEIMEGEVLTPGDIPTGRAFVSEWKTIERLPFSVYYTGAKICTVTTGPFYQKMILNFCFTGTALTNPSI